MDDDIFFIDDKRGIFGSKNGNIYITIPGSYDLRDDPFVVPFPYRIVVKDEYDPFAVIFTESGYIYVLNIQLLKWHLKTTLPPNIGVIDSLEIKNDGNSILLMSNRNSYIYQNGWICLSEQIESLIVKRDQKLFAQATQLENDICTAKLMGDFEQFVNAIEKYLIYVANYSSNEIFIKIWYDLIKQKYPFNSEDIHNMWSKCINLISTIDRLLPFKDELKMSIGEGSILESILTE
ncbi:hypothetical protein M9Y10_041948 [Tritrichomonas musculus]|uniref:Uncharacterized protein n=1 Tax=Tritrichomonas musculus TaxID=1915356 RepID=A0ABR2K5S9_9EUKA